MKVYNIFVALAAVVGNASSAHVAAAVGEKDDAVSFSSTKHQNLRIVQHPSSMGRYLSKKKPSHWEEKEQNGKGPNNKKEVGAVVIKNKQCTFLDGVPLPDTGDVVATRSIEIINDNNGLQSCTFDNVPNPIGGVVKWDYKNTVSYGKDGYGFFCCINGDESEGGTMTTDWTQTISPSGQSILTCKFDFAGITGEMFDGTLGKKTTYPCNDVYPGLTCC